MVEKRGVKAKVWTREDIAKLWEKPELTISELARIMDRQWDSVQRSIYAGKIPASKKTGVYLIKREDALAYVKKTHDYVASRARNTRLPK